MRVNICQVNLCVKAAIVGELGWAAVGARISVCQVTINVRGKTTCQDPGFILPYFWLENALHAPLDLT